MAEDFHDKDLRIAVVANNNTVQKQCNVHKLAGIIDHTLLKPEATAADIIKICDEAKKYNFASVCVNASNIKLVTQLLKGSQVKSVAVVGFPLGATTTSVKTFEAREAIAAGAEEIDMVLNIGALKSKNYQMVYEDIHHVVEVSRPRIVKVIIETSSLQQNEKIAACVLAKAAGADFVKTSTGFGGGGATIEDLKLMREIVGVDMQIKASGGIRTKDDVMRMVAAGADRIGASASVAIVVDEKILDSNY